MNSMIRNEKKDMEQQSAENRIWLMPANPKNYDIEAAFRQYDTIEWKQSYTYEVGDIIYIYVSGTVRQVRYKVEVVETSVKREPSKNGKQFWKDIESQKGFQEVKRMKIRLLEEVDTPELSLNELREQGLKGNIQGAMKLKGDLRKFIELNFSH
ncbi:EVE domain-containing protein [Halobacillus salinus]|uniref:EVE domain-containing protein n=1 Tax=Halobacillus salinus TaxID=192814 RepID=UPI0009A6B054|nr:EVE domain-containing protein [Halobacillus salinus]